MILNSFFSNDGIGEIQGLLGWQHLVFTLSGIFLITILLLMTYKTEKSKIRGIIRTVFWLVLILEILKIIWNLTVRENVTRNDWIPLYYCSIFIYASGLASYGKGKLKELGEACLFFGQIVAGSAFLLYPSTALAIHPLLHVLTIHSLVYHSLAIYIGILIVISGYYKPNLKVFGLYSISLFVFSALVYGFNIIFGTNMMFLNDAVGIKPLMIVYNISKVFYPVIVSLAQIVGSFFISFGIYKLVIWITSRKHWSLCI